LDAHVTPVFVTVFPVPLESVVAVPLVDARRRRDVPATAVRGCVGRLKGAVYTADPLTHRKFVMYPLKAAPTLALGSLPIARGPLLVKFVVLTKD
jgi:hypothetical protein